MCRRQLFYMEGIKNKNFKHRNTIIGIVGVVLFATIYMIFSTKKRNEVFEAENVHSLFDDSTKNEIKKLNIKYRSYHLILDDDREYYFTIDKVSGILDYKDPLFKYVDKGDSIIKNGNSRSFVIKRKNKGFIEVTFFK